MAIQKLPLMQLLLLISIVASLTTADLGSTDHDIPLRSAKEPVCPPKPSETLSRAHFPEGFVFGTATAAYQVEGAVYETSRGRSMWDVHCMKYPTKCNEESGEEAIDFFHRYKEDIKIMKDLNTDAFRMSISWPRIFPYGKKERKVSQEGVQFYHDVIDELIRNEITPFVTIFHWDTPQDLEDEYGGFLSEKIVKDFWKYAEFLFNEYGGKVKNWITINEPWVYAHTGYDVGKKAPGRCSNYVNKNCTGGESGKEAYVVTHNLLLSHAEAVEAFRKCQKNKCAGGKIGIAHSPAWFVAHDENDENDKAAVEKALKFMLGWHLDPTTSGDYPQEIKDSVGDRLPIFTKEQQEKLKGSTDFVGLNYYTSVFAKHIKTPNGVETRFRQDSGSEWELEDKNGFAIGGRSTTSVPGMSVYSRGLRSLLKYIKDHYENPEIIIMENGYGDILGEAKNVSVEAGINDSNRKTYIHRHLYNMHQAICEDGVNVKGYFVWSLFDNFEWQDGYSVRFGLYFIDFREGMNLTRHEKLSGKFYKQFLSEGFRPSNTSKEKDEL